MKKVYFDPRPIVSDVMSDDLYVKLILSVNNNVNDVVVDICRQVHIQLTDSKLILK